MNCELKNIFFFNQVLENVHMISPYEKVQLLKEHSKILNWSLTDLRGLVYGVENQLRGRIPR
jgi:hypothetical protein